MYIIINKSKSLTGLHEDHLERRRHITDKISYLKDKCLLVCVRSFRVFVCVCLSAFNVVFIILTVNAVVFTGESRAQTKSQNSELFKQSV